MSNKISEERLAQLEASLQEVGNAFGWASISEQLELVRIARRAAEVKPVDLSDIDHLLGYQQKWVFLPDVVKAIKAAGGTVKE